MNENKNREISKTNKIGINRLRSIGLIVFLSFLLCACALQQSEDEEGKLRVDVYYLNKEETKVASESYTPEESTRDAMLPELIQVLSTQPENVNLVAPVSDGFHVLNYSVEEKQLILNLDVRYLDMDATKEILTRAALVRTLTQIPGIDYVSITVENEPLQDSTGNLVGTLTSDMFIDNAGTEINSYEKVKLHLYFANKAGDGLIEVNRTIVYNSNISLEKLVVEQVIAGPTNDESYPTINPSTKIVNVTVKDGICYVNLDDAFLTQPYNVTSEVTIYSMANSLIELSNVNKVQISINGKTDMMYRENTNLSNFFERNLDLVHG
ncbi:MAG: GerMN domain-containing protein [Lachnospiraceae bacterium]|nr:GerMN domain-containing protein [Lachnospiraceae bacterium]